MFSAMHLDKIISLKSFEQQFKIWEVLYTKNPNNHEVGVIRIPILLKVRRKGETSWEMFRFYYIDKLAMMCHLAQAIVGALNHILEIMKLRFKEVILPQITKLP